MGRTRRYGPSAIPPPRCVSHTASQVTGSQVYLCPGTKQHGDPGVQQRSPQHALTSESGSHGGSAIHGMLLSTTHPSGVQVSPSAALQQPTLSALGPAVM